ncbi:hypothetical protein BSQ44_06800 [Aquibium oceanicum]|uniref:Uncharacterized protein n=2 Tax=Aquibium oceanicum TaxID=1670800 RepID=A0A1L3SNX4_9HYPH|nr:hypothetical protein BSQ44_06800 [Aquibium oceanicum]
MIVRRCSQTSVSIQTKLTWLVLSSLGVALLMASVISMWHEANQFLLQKRETMAATAQVFGAAVSAATADDDAAGVQQSLRGIARIPHLLFAEVIDRDGSQLASIGSVVRLESDVDIGDTFASKNIWRLLFADTVAVTTPVIDGGEEVGKLTLIAESDLLSQVWTVLGYALVGSAVALVPSLLLAWRLQRSITRPLHQLTRAMDDVARTGKYSQVSIKTPDSETAQLAASFNAMVSEIGAATDKILSREGEIIQRLSRAGELRDDQTGQHVVRVAKISRVVAEKLGLDPTFVEDLCRASPMHDVGKISIPDAILHKPGKLDDDERREMETHALRGYEILSGSDSELVQLAAEIALSHHERWDGKGYPRRISGDDIPISGRLTAVADVCDALLSERPYKKPWPLSEVKRHFAENAGTHFDPACVDALLSCWSQVEEVYANDRGEATFRYPAIAS